MTEDEMVGWHHRLDRHELEQTLGVGDGQGSLVCCSPWGHKESDTTEKLNNNSYSDDHPLFICFFFKPYDFLMFILSPPSEI